MMLTSPGENVAGSFTVLTKHGRCILYVTSHRLVIESYKHGCILILDLIDIHSHDLDAEGRKGGRLTIRSNAHLLFTISSPNAAEIHETISTVLAEHQSVLLKMGAWPPAGRSQSDPR